MLSTFTASRLTVFTFNTLFSKRTWKLIAAGIVLSSLWYSYYSFVHTFNVVRTNGVYGIVTEGQWHEIVTASPRNEFLEAELSRLEMVNERTIENCEVYN